MLVVMREAGFTVKSMTQLVIDQPAGNRERRYSKRLEKLGVFSRQHIERLSMFDLRTLRG